MAIIRKPIAAAYGPVVAPKDEAHTWSGYIGYVDRDGTLLVDFHIGWTSTEEEMVELMTPIAEALGVELRKEGT